MWKILIVAISTCALTTAPLRTAGTTSAPVDLKRQDVTAEKLKELLRERLSTASEELKARQAEYEGGRGTLDAYLGTLQRWLKARLELAATKEERDTARREHLELLQGLEKVTRLLFEAGRVAHVHCLQVKYARLDAEIEILRARHP